jgi:carbon-monoxide dehydrogenase large subunit
MPFATQFSGRLEDERLATGRGRYTDDVAAPDALHIVFVRAPYASADVRGIDRSAAAAHAGVVAVLTHDELAADGFAQWPNPFRFPQGDGSFAMETPRPLLVQDRVRHIGEPVAMVLATTLQAAMDAAELVEVDYEDRPAVVDVLEARKEAAPQLWDDRAGNQAYHWRHGDMAQVQAALAASAHRVELTSRISRVGAMPLEPRTATASIGNDGRPVLMLSHQSPHAMRDELASYFKLEPAQLRVVTGDVGGSFGMKWGPQREEMLTFWAALHTKRAVRWTATRSESFLADEQARDMVVTSELGLDAQGRFTALAVHYQSNVGAYMFGRSTAPVNNIGGLSGVYTTPAVAADVVGVFTNTQSTAAYRGAGRPDATYAIERVIDVAAARLAIDPAELRRRNLIPASAMPYRTSFRFEYDCGEFERNLNHALQLADYAGFAQRRAQSASRGMLRGIGMALPIEMAGAMGTDNATVQPHADGTVTLSVGSKSVGQGHETTFSQMVADALEIPLSQVRYSPIDTDILPTGRGNGGSSAMIQGGSAVRGASEELITKAREMAAQQLEASSADLVFGSGGFTVVGTDRRVTLAQLASAQAARAAQMQSHAASPSEALMGAGQFGGTPPTFPNGCHLCELEIDPRTGEVTPLRYVCVEDVGRVINAALVEGQIHGGVAQGIGQALMEQIRYDGETGQLLSGSFQDYAMPRASDLPEMESVNLETPTQRNPLGVKGVGEAGTVGALSATMNAVCDALRAAGIEHIDMPATAPRVWEALQAAKSR